MQIKNEQEIKDLCGIYKITHRNSGKVYVGQTKVEFKRRFWHHKWKLNNNTHDNQYLQNTWNKYEGEEFCFEVVKVLGREDDMNELEIKYIKELNAFGEGGFNLTIGGEGKKGCPMSENAKLIVGHKNRIHNLGKKHSEATKLKMSVSSPRRRISAEHRKVLDKSRIGSKHTDESKALMSKSHTGKGSVLDNCKAANVKRLLIQGSTRNEISSAMDISYAVVKSIIDGVAWRHVFVEGWDSFIINREKNKQVYRTQLSDDEVGYIRLMLSEGKTQAEISRELGVGNSTISRIKSGKIYINVK